MVKDSQGEKRRSSDDWAAMKDRVGLSMTCGWPTWTPPDFGASLSALRKLLHMNSILYRACLQVVWYTIKRLVNAAYTSQASSYHACKPLLWRR